jgi:hypothetical protein
LRIERSSQGLSQSRYVKWRTHGEVIDVIGFIGVIVSQKFDFASALGGFSGALYRQKGGGC